MDHLNDAITQELPNASGYLITSMSSFNADTTRVDSDSNAVSSTAPSSAAALDNDMVIGGMEGMVIRAAAVFLVRGPAVCIPLSVQHACARQKRVHPSCGETTTSSTSKHLPNSLPGVPRMQSSRLGAFPACSGCRGRLVGLSENRGPNS